MELMSDGKRAKLIIVRRSHSLSSTDYRYKYSVYIVHRTV